jgi:hypothetical protein
VMIVFSWSIIGCDFAHVGEVTYQVESRGGPGGIVYISLKRRTILPTFQMNDLGEL